MSYRLLLLSAAAAATLGLAACEENKTQAPVTGAPLVSLPLAEGAPPPEAFAPYAGELPAAPPLRRVSARRPAYAYIDDAYDLGYAFADSPPDYFVEYLPDDPWIHQPFEKYDTMRAKDIAG